ncbi:MAG: hypothetical protein US94_C0006G0003 [Berkelbacteria bacterium GW2011_GWB1_38_5]|uniref:Ribosomal subunit interface protein n=2 Tax=Candidatus Berkelbacteria TaxID=1618330 RepID=A0A0G0PN13_9BACT|nr:MAG: hypothetical protein US94_C0006G0003 [Berkelbacteria bacterium GW2011_GWB1_38_5]KKQ90671.1 MAG: hypothetical protein UT15_C0007G0003 [Berkelbacteria bacterium GW2011_GWA1_39_10]
MKIIIRGKNNYKVDQNLYSYIQEKIERLDKFVKEPVVCEVTLSEKSQGPKRGLDKDVHISLTMAESKNPIFSHARTNEFMASIDIAYKKIEHELQNIKEKEIGSRFPTKYYEAKIEEEKANEL